MKIIFNCLIVHKTGRGVNNTINERCHPSKILIIVIFAIMISRYKKIELKMSVHCAVANQYVLSYFWVTHNAKHLLANCESIVYLAKLDESTHMIIILVILMRFEMRIKSSEMNFFVFHYRVMVTCQNSL